MDAIEFLTRDHDAVKAVLAAANTYDEMKAGFGGISRILETHTYLEERFFYPAFENHEELRQLIQDAREQHESRQATTRWNEASEWSGIRKKFSNPQSRSAAAHDFRGRRDFSPGPAFDR